MRDGGRSEAADGAGSGPLRVVDRAAGAGPAPLLAAAQPEDLVEVGFLARRLADGAARRRAAVQEGAASARPLAASYRRCHGAGGVRVAARQRTMTQNKYNDRMSQQYVPPLNWNRLAMTHRLSHLRLFESLVCRAVGGAKREDAERRDAVRKGEPEDARVSKCSRSTKGDYLKERESGGERAVEISEARRAELEKKNRM